MVHTVQQGEGEAEIVHGGCVEEAKIVGYLCSGALARDKHLLVEVLVKHLQRGVCHHHLVLVNLAFPALVTKTVGTRNLPSSSTSSVKASGADGRMRWPRIMTPSMSNRSPKSGDLPDFLTRLWKKGRRLIREQHYKCPKSLSGHRLVGIRKKKHTALI
ncbi:hypothetical protein E2C01_018003 [Portunus trituberculatus]|uniref:Uncharacterized protein n=1 Tax=Portunus trituberculatus TaxID=210409 RepID=A0A5B7DV25_PORTR|nr:hypothetical protein [Portunus trituberculatus]